MPIALDTPAAEVAIAATTNAFRKEHKLPALRLNAQLTAAARAYAKVLAARAELTHTANGTTTTSRAKAAGYAFCEIAENLAAIHDRRGFTAPGYAKRAVASWEASPAHRENLLRANVTEIGVGVAGAPNNDPRYTAVQLFGTPLALRYTFTLTNRASQAVAYVFAGRQTNIRPRETIRHTTCAPGSIAITTEPQTGTIARYEARDGQVYTLKPRAGGGVTVEVSGPTEPAASQWQTRVNP
jgi:Cysteine-rich secretory protein family